MQQTAPEIPLRPQDEVACERCAVRCEKVVYPAACVARSCPFLYAYEAFGHTYIGCMQKVYGVEIDLDLLQEAEDQQRGFGAIRALKKPLPMCRSAIDRCYTHRDDEIGCRNPEFAELPAGEPTFKVFARLGTT